MLYIGREIILPVIFSTMIAIVLSPMVNFLVRKKINRVLAIIISLTAVSIVAISLIVLLSSQIAVFAESFPKLLNELQLMLNRSTIWLSKNLNISTYKINKFIEDTKSGMISGEQSSIGTTLATVGNTVLVMFLIPVYIFMILFYQPLLLNFIRRLFGDDHQEKVNEILTSIKSIIQRYLVALLIEAAIIATLNSIGLLLIGIDYAILLGIIGALLNIIPYIGGVLAVSLPVMIAIATKSSHIYPLMVLALYIVIQFIDNHYVIPKVVASKVKVNALMSIIVVLGFGALWGIPGMFLSIPLTAIVKVIFDHVDSLKPWGLLLGDTMPAIAIFKIPNKKIKYK